MRKRELKRRLTAAQRQVEELEGALRERALRDPVTGVHSLEGLARRAEAEVERCRRHGRRLAMASLDIDDFHSINAAHGSALGDELLQAVGHVLTRHTRVSDVVCRAGADEFLVLLPETDAAAATRAFERVLLELEGLRTGPVESVSASVGIAEWRQSMTADMLITLAEERMRSARDAGGARAVALPPAEDGGRGAGDDPRRDAIAGLAEALLERDRYTGEHSELVVGLATRVARGLGLDGREVEQVRSAALLHDIGKVAIPDDVLAKAGPLDELEWAVMREHPVIGERILRAIPGLGGVARIVRHEHERWDGRGYPDGLSGEEIPIGARIILPCDAYHAMTSDRPYRRAIPHADAIRELGRGAGAQFDPQVTEVLIGFLYGSRQMAAGATA